MEGADQVLALGRVDPGLAADRAVDLGEQRRRDLHEADAAAHHRRGEAGEVADHPAAEGDDEVVAADLLGDQPFDGALEPGPALGRLAGRQLEDRGLDRRPRPARPRSAGRCSAATRASVRTATRAAAEEGGDLGPGAGEEARADADVVGAGAERDGDGLASSARAPGSGGGRGMRPVVGADGGDDLARHRLVAGAAAAVDDDVGLGVDRRAAAVEVGEHAARVGGLQQRPARGGRAPGPRAGRGRRGSRPRWRAP